MPERSVFSQRHSDLRQRPDTGFAEEAPLQQGLDGAYGQKALNRIRKAVEGNGLDPESVLLGAVDGQVYGFDAHIYFRFAPKVSEEAVPAGRPPEVTAQTLPTRADLDREIAVYTHKIVEDPTSGAQAAVALLSRPDKGFGFTQETLPAAFPPKHYLLKEPCPDCKGASKAACARCKGTAKMACPKCKTVKLAICPLCYGRKTGADKKTPCIKCRGHGRIPCMACRQTGYIPCNECSGTGRNTCKTCAGSGTSGRKITVEMSVLADYDYDRSVLPAELAQFVEKLGPKIIAQGHATLEPGPIGRGEDRTTFVIPCRLNLPFAQVGILMPDQNFTCTVFGHTARVTALPPFLDKIIEPGVRELRKAAASGNIALPHLRRACQFRTIKSAIIAAAKSSPGQAIEALRRENGTTVSPAMAKNLVALSNRALNRIATIPTLLGMMTGLAAAAGLYALAFSSGGRTLIAATIPAAMGIAALDLVVFIAGGFLTSLGASLGGRHAFASILGRTAGNRQGITIRRTWALVLGWGLSLVVFAAIAYSGLHGRTDAPVWFRTLTGLLAP